jgi:hypothetical protein
MILATGTTEEIYRKAPKLSRSAHRCEAIRETKKGEYFLRASGVKDVFHLEIAEQDFSGKRCYPIINDVIGDFYKSMVV